MHGDNIEMKITFTFAIVPLPTHPWPSRRTSRRLDDSTRVDSLGIFCRPVADASNSLHMDASTIWMDGLSVH